MQSNGLLLETRGLVAFYGDSQALFGVDFQVERNETVAIIGSKWGWQIHSFEKHHWFGSS
jgi:ABC-type branched-subunit amino acid transport system ATPase component